MGNPPFSGAIMKVLGLKPWENRMRAHADQMNGRNLGYPKNPELYHWQNFPQYQHHYRNRHPIQSHDGRLHHLSAEGEYRAWLRYHDIRRYEEEQLARRYGRHPRRHRHPPRFHPRHNIDEDYEDEYDEGDLDEDFEVDEHTDSASSMSYERTRRGHARGHGPRSRGGRRLHGWHPQHHGMESHGGWNGRMEHGGYPERGFYEDEYY